MGGSSSTISGGYRVFVVYRGSPAAKAGLDPFFDYIVRAGDLLIDSSNIALYNKFSKKIEEHLGKELLLSVFSAKTQDFREVTIVPAKWENAGALGASISFDTFDNCFLNGVRVISVSPNSPADAAGLVSHADYLISAADVLIEDLEGLYAIARRHIGRELSAVVYNSDSETSRRVSIYPSMDWGGEGILGCDVAKGMLHTIPIPRRKHRAEEIILASLPPTAASTGDEMNASSLDSNSRHVDDVPQLTVEKEATKIAFSDDPNRRIRFEEDAKQQDYSVSKPLLEVHLSNLPATEEDTVQVASLQPSARPETGLEEEKKELAERRNESMMSDYNTPVKEANLSIEMRVIAGSSPPPAEEPLKAYQTPQSTYLEDKSLPLPDMQFRDEKITLQYSQKDSPGVGEMSGSHRLDAPTIAGDGSTGGLRSLPWTLEEAQKSFQDIEKSLAPLNIGNAASELKNIPQLTTSADELPPSVMPNNKLEASSLAFSGPARPGIFYQ